MTSAPAQKAGPPRRCPARLIAASAASAALLLALALPGSAGAAPSLKKAIWGPATPSAFANYSRLGVGIYETSISWRAIAPRRPNHPRNPADPAYNWPAELDTAIARAKNHGIRVAVNLTFSPGWANGHRSYIHAPNHPADFADFAAAAARRYPYVRYWMIWSEPSRRSNFLPMANVQSGRRLTHREGRGPRLYARILDASYGAIKSVDRNDLVVGGLTMPGGSIRPQRFIQALRLPGGKPPRMDLYGHNGYSPRLPKLSRGPFAPACADLSDLDTLTGWLDRYLARDGRDKRLRVFVSEYSLPTNRNDVLPFWGNRRDQANYARAALRLDRSFGRVYTLGWFQAYDEPPQHNHLQANWGLLTFKGQRKPAFYAYKNG